MVSLHLFCTSFLLHGVHVSPIRKIVHICMKKVCFKKSCLTLLQPHGLCLSDSFVHGISQARIMEWVAISFSRASSSSRDKTHFSCISCIRFLTTVPCGKPLSHIVHPKFAW